ncbi:MAG: hypothetical protein IT343_08915 [Candidatus Melainabacteria bacterium]|jgi:hypothetical protein|nr:hypothetical protein [Candidatus Melainabacteria bacterium]
MPSFDNFFSKVKDAAKDAADKTGKQAKIAKLRINIKTLDMEKNRHFQTIGLRTFILWTESRSLDGLVDRVHDELTQIERAEARIKELEEEISEIHAGSVDVSDVTEEEGEKQS